MNKIIPSIIVCILFLFPASCRKEELHVRPITIRVIDYDTEYPLEGIEVFYELEEQQLKFCIENIVPLGGAIKDFFYYKKHDFTNENGEVIFSQMCKKRNENEYHEYIHVNIVANESPGFEEPIKLKIKNRSYFAFYISNYDHCFNDMKDWDYKACNSVDVLINGGSLKKTSEILIIKLRKIAISNKSGVRYEIKCNK